MRVAIIHDSLNDFRGAEVLVLFLANVLRGLGYKIVYAREKTGWKRVERLPPIPIM